MSAKQTPLAVRGKHAGHNVNPLITEDGFTVTVEREVGRVTFGDGEHAPHEAAFLLIANYGEDGTFKFPGPANGVTVEVTVNTVDTTGVTS